MTSHPLFDLGEQRDAVGEPLIIKYAVLRAHEDAQSRCRAGLS